MTQTPGQRMYAAINAGDADCVRRILRENPEQLTDSPGVASSWLHYAAWKGKSAIVDVFLAAGLDVNSRPSLQRDTALENAIGRGHYGVAKHLLSLGASPNLGRELIGAINAKENSFELVKLLVEQGADVNRVWRFGDEEKGPLFNALSFAISKRRDDVADYLRAQGAVMPPVDISETRTSAADEISEFFRRRFGDVDQEALREIVPTSDCPVTIHRIGPSGERESQILFTTGICEKPMQVSVGADAYRFGELLIELPADWPLSREALENPDLRWPIDWLRKVAAYQRQEETWLGGPFIIMSNGDPPAPFAPGCRFSAMLILTGYDDLGPMTLQSGKLVQIYTLIPLYAEEKELEQRHDLPELFRRLDQFGVGRMVDVRRPNVARAH